MKRTDLPISDRLRSMKLQSTQTSRSTNKELYDKNHNEHVKVQKNVSTGAVPRKYVSVAKSVQKTKTGNPLLKASPITKTNTTNIMRFIKTKADELNWEAVSYEDTHVHFIKLNQTSAEYLEVQNLFKKTNKKHFKITQIERVQNPFLLAAFLLKAEEMRNRLGFQNSTKLFHGTKNSSAMNICSDNFDWRLYGRNYGHKFGRGVSFTPISNYATHYGKEDADDCVMLMTIVLVGKKATGTGDMDLPPAGCDTSIKPNGDVLVKYEDNEFYPAYKIAYESVLKPRPRNNANYYYNDEDDGDYDEEDEDYDEEDEYYDEDGEDYDEEDDDHDEDDEDYDEEDEEYDEEDEEYDEEDEDYEEDDGDYDEEDDDYEEEGDDYDEEDDDYNQEDEDYYEGYEDYYEGYEDYDEEDEYYGSGDYYY